MARRIGDPVAVETRDDGRPIAFTWRRVMYRVRVIGQWRLATRWWGLPMQPIATTSVSSHRTSRSSNSTAKLLPPTAFLKASAGCSTVARIEQD